MRKLFRMKYLQITYVCSGEKTGIIGDDGHFCAVIARLVEHPILELHEYVRIPFESGVKVPVVTLWLGAELLIPSMAFHHSYSE